MTPRPLALLALLALAPAAHGGALTDLLMAPGVFAAAPPGAAIAYAEERTVAEGGTLDSVAGGEIRLEVREEAGARELTLVREKDGAAQPVGTFPTTTANPLLLYFLETTVRATAEATGGSPYYIRNRMREALAAADLGAEATPAADATAADGTAAGAGREVTLVPFADDPNRARLGDFADLTLRLRFDPARPERILELSADTTPGAGGYHEKMILIAED